MDPKQTEGQNSGSGTLSTGANISRTMDALNVNERKSATSNSPFAKHHFDKVAPGTGDILIDPSAGSIISSTPAENKGINRGRLIQFGLIFGGIALIALVIFTVVMVINNQPKGNSSSNTNNNNTILTRNPRDAFEEFLEVLINGKIGSTTYTAGDGKTYTFLEALQAASGLGSNNILYADSVINFDTSDNRSVYLSDLSSALEIFSRNYSGENEDLLDQISYYFVDFANVMPVTETLISDNYQKMGYDETTKYVNDTYSFNDDRGINDYNTYSREYATAILNLLNDAKTKLGCEVTDSASATACTNLTTLDSYQAYVNAETSYFGTAALIKQNARLDALSAIGTMYLEYNDVEDEGLES